MGQQVDVRQVAADSAWSDQQPFFINCMVIATWCFFQAGHFGSSGRPACSQSTNSVPTHASVVLSQLDYATFSCTCYSSLKRPVFGSHAHDVADLKWRVQYRTYTQNIQRVHKILEELNNAVASE
jgi:hypothetical protein